jgi:hypothetical protein
MFDFGIQRLLPTVDGRRYHLFNDQNELVLIADFGSPWLASEPRKQVRFAHSDGRLVATLEFPDDAFRRNEAARSYAIIFDYAVYALINEIRPSPGASGAADLSYTIEAGGNRWLLLPHGEQALAYALHRLPRSFGRNLQPNADELPEPVGSIRRAEGGFDYVASIPDEVIAQSALITLALIFLLDDGPDAT